MGKKLLLAVCVVILLSVIFLQIKYTEKQTTQTPGVDLKIKRPASGAPLQSSAQKVLSFNLEGYRDNGEKKWELNSACADIFSNVIKLDSVVAKTYGDGGFVTLKAEKGIYDKNTKDIQLKKNVVGKSSDGATILTETLDWNQKAECIMTDALVRITKDNLFSVGRGAVGSPSLKQVELKKNITVKIRGNPPTIITCDGPLVVNYKRNIAILNNNVRISDPQAEIYSNTMKILFDPETDKITRVVAIGNVRIKRDGNLTYSGRAIYTVEDGRVRLVGKPKIIVFPEEEKDAPVGDQGAS